MTSTSYEANKFLYQIMRNFPKYKKYNIDFVVKWCIVDNSADNNFQCPRDKSLARS